MFISVSVSVKFKKKISKFYVETKSLPNGEIIARKVNYSLHSLSRAAVRPRPIVTPRLPATSLARNFVAPEIQNIRVLCPAAAKHVTPRYSTAGFAVAELPSKFEIPFFSPPER